MIDPFACSIALSYYKMSCATYIVKTGVIQKKCYCNFTRTVFNLLSLLMRDQRNDC